MSLNLNDKTSNGNNLTNSGATASSSVPFHAPNNSHSLDLEFSDSQYASITDASQTGLDITGNMTLEFWVKFESLPTTSTSTNYMVISKSVDSGNQRSYFLSYANSDAAGAYQWWFGISSDGTTGNRTIGTVADTNISTGVWYRLSLVYTASSGSTVFYKNGIQLGTMSSLKTAIYNSTAPFVIGAGNGGASGFFDGLIDDVRVWAGTRTAQQISDNFAKELVGNETNLVGYWKLNNNYNDSTSNANNLTASGSPVFSTDVGFYGTNTVSADFEESESDYVYITDANQTGLDLTGDFTIELWTRFESLPANTQNFTIANKYVQTGNQRAYRFLLDNQSGTYRLGLLVSSDGSANEILTVNWTPTVNIWYHLVCIRNSTAKTAAYYVNGVIVGTSSAGSITGQFNSSADFIIGRAGDTLSPFDGLIDEVRVWNDIRTASEIANNFTRPLVGNESGLVGYWMLGDLSQIKKIAGVSYANIKKIAGVTIANAKKVAGVA